jgi:hypothetical protein
MISAWWLLLIIPASACAGLVLGSCLAAAGRADERWDEWEYEQFARENEREAN